MSTPKIDDRLLGERLLAIAGEPQLLAGNRMGLERECLRLTPDGHIATTPHPPALGSALTHPWITTDYSEALLEFVTPPQRRPADALQFLTDVHQFTCERLAEDELLWALSMPCPVSDDRDIPIAQYGSSNVGTMKTVYRRGLGHRYGRAMQAIAGMHFNYSFGDAFWERYLDGARGAARQAAISDAYMGLLRNFRRYGWLVLLLFGASPAACLSFLGGRRCGLELDGNTLIGPCATSLRMSDIGYKNNVQAQLGISLNSLDEYVRDIVAATRTTYPPYEQLGVVVDGHYRQLSAAYLQIENEYYSVIRPKRVARSGEKPSSALRRGGVEYVEVRALDVNPFDPVGANPMELRFLEMLLLLCLLGDSPPISAQEQEQLERNHLAVARRGRDPQLHLCAVDGGTGPLVRDAATELCERMAPIAELYDAADGGDAYAAALATQLAAVREPARTPSALILAEMREQDAAFSEFGMRLSLDHREHFRRLSAANAGRSAEFDELAKQSTARQRDIEAADDIDFAEYLRRYFAQ